MFENSVEELRERVAGLAGDDLSSVFDDEVQAGVVAIVALRNLAELAEARWLAELDDRKVTDTADGMKTVAWVADRAGVAPGPTRQRLRIGHALRSRLPLVDAAASTGELSFDHVRALVQDGNPRVRDAIADLQADLIDAADGATFVAWRTDVRRAVSLLDQDGPTPAATDPGANRLAMTAELDGTFHLDATFCAEDGQLVRSAIDQIADELFRRAERDHQQAGELPAPLTRRRRADALVELCRRGLALALDSSTPARVAATVVVHDNGHVADDTGQPVRSVVFDRWACDLDVTVMAVTAGGEPLRLGRAHRHPNRAQRRALRIRDGGCVFPGCDVPVAWCDAHHVTWWTNGGRTDVDQLALLCHHHHKVAHRPGWTMHTTPDQHFWWETPTGQTLHSQRHGHRQPPDHADADDQHTSEGTGHDPPDQPHLAA